MKKLSKFNVLIWFLCCCLTGTTTAEAKVCFAGDGDCGGIETFGGYEDPTENLKDQCAKAGYEDVRSNCTAIQGKQITDYCPYDSNYVKCCSLEYMYDSCVYPMVQAGKCGNKYKCVCDSSKYKYTQENCNIDYPNSTPSGAACAQVEYNTSSMTTSNKILFTECSCNEALYPYVPAGVDPKNPEGDCKWGTAPMGRVCRGVDSNGKKIVRYESCLCNTDYYSYSSSYCDSPENDRWGGNNNEKCTQGSQDYYHSCLVCGSDYPATSRENISGVACRYLADVEKTEETIVSSRIVTINGVKYYKPSASATCGYAECPYGSRYKILNCQKGYKPSKDGKTCELLSCSEALMEWVKEQGSKSTYAVIGQYSSETINSATQQYVIIANDLNANILRKGKRYYGGRYFATMQNNQALMNSCKVDPKVVSLSSAMATANPSSQSTYSTYFYGLDLTFNQATTFSTSTYFYGCAINAKNALTFNSAAYLYPVPCDIKSRQNSAGLALSVTASKIVINASFLSYGYNYQNAGNVYITNKAANAVMFGNESANTDTKFSSCKLSTAITFKASSFNLKGIAAFRNAYIYPGFTCIGCSKDALNPASGYFITSGINSVLSLYDSYFYVKEPAGTANSLYMTTSTMLGSPGDSTSRVVFADGTYKYVSLAQLFGYCSNNGNTGYKYVSSNGILANGTKACNVTFFGSVPCREGREKNDDILCHFNAANAGNRSLDGRYNGENNGDCSWDGSRSKCKTQYFKFG